MIDPAILMHMEATMPPQPPVTAQERVWLSPKGAAAQRVSQKLVDAYSAKADEWARQLDGFKAELQSIKPTPPEGDKTLATLDRMIEEYEAHADIRAMLAARLVKRVRREVKAMFKVEPSVAAVSRAAGQTLIATDKRIVEELLAFALVLRAIRSEAAGEDQGGPTFDDPADLKRYLDDLAA